MTNYRAMQVAGSQKTPVNKVLPKPTEIRMRYLSMGSWKASLSKGGEMTKIGIAKKRKGNG